MAALNFRPVHIAVLTLVVALGLLIGCGGGGGGGSSSSSSTSSTSSTSGTTINPGYESSGVTTTNSPSLSPGDQATLVASVTSNGVTSALTPYNYVVTGGATVGTVTAGGILTAGSGVVAGATYTVTASSSSGTVSWSFTGAAPLSQPAVVGVVESSASQAGVAGATITAYDRNSNVVGTATSAADGTFTMSVTTAATEFGISIAGVSAGSNTFYSEFDYRGTEYATSTPSCLPSLPALTSGNHRYALPVPVLLDAEVSDGSIFPPPPPAACLG